MVITEAVRTDEATMNNHRPITSRANKAPVYTKDKRDKFTQRENKKWVRLATVVGYLISVCIPAIALTVYYVGFWDPQYKIKIGNDSISIPKNDRVYSIPTTDPPPKRETRSGEILKCPDCKCNTASESSDGNKIGLTSVLTGRYYATSSTEEPVAPSVNDFDDYQNSLGSNEETITYGHKAMNNEKGSVLT